MTTERVQLGAHGEQLARTYLESQGYLFVAANIRTPQGEIDLLMWEHDILSFVEVRTLSSVEFGTPLETLNAAKMRRVWRAAGNVLSEWEGPKPRTRIDAVGVVLASPPDLTLVRGAFENGW